MAWSDVDICNIALGRIGVDRTISSLDEASKEARTCKRYLALCREVVLEQMPWAFAARVAALSRLPDAQVLPGFAYQYALPADAAGVFAVIPAGELETTGAAVRDCCGPWLPQLGGRYAFRRAVSADGTRAAILSNVPDAYAVYTAKLDDSAGYSAMFVSMLADRLAMEIAMPLTTDPRWFQVAQQRFVNALADTAARDFEQAKDPPELDPPAIRARA